MVTLTFEGAYDTLATGYAGESLSETGEGDFNSVGGGRSGFPPACLSEMAECDRTMGR